MHKTNNFGFTCALVSLGYRIVKVEGNREKTFYFDNEDFPALLINYLNDDLQVSAKTYFNNIKTIKSLTL